MVMSVAKKRLDDLRQSIMGGRDDDLCLYCLSHETKIRKKEIRTKDTVETR